MMAFFLTMPISRMTPISAMMVKGMPKTDQRRDRADAGRGQRGENGDRVNEALVEHAEHDVDRGDRRQHEELLVGERLLEHQRRAGEGSGKVARQADRLRRRAAIAAVASLSDLPGARLNEIVVATYWL